MNQQVFQELIERYLAGIATESERDLLEETLSQMGDAGTAKMLDHSQEEALKASMFARTKEIIQSRSGSLPPTIPFYRKNFVKYAAAVAGVVLLGMSVWIVSSHKLKIPGKPGVPATATKKDVEPGKEGAILTLADGATIVLDSAGSGLLASQNGVSIIKNGHGVNYQEGQAAAEAVMNTMTTPRGRQYNLTLSDGTRVWLNAASSITFPTVFNGSERKVSVTGEAYFEVAHNKRMPFTVAIPGGARALVLGTHFNINAYDNEPAARTTLLEGSVKMISGENLALLTPGQQAICLKDKRIIDVYPVDTDEVMAWKEGFFQFDHADLRYLLRQLARWYDLDIVFEGNPDNRKLGGRINRNLHLSAVLKALEAKEIRYRLEGKKLIVL